MPIARPPADEIYQATWDDVPLPATRDQAFDAPGRPRGQQIYQEVQDCWSARWPDEDRRWRLLRNYYYNCIRDCDRQVVRVLDALRQSGMDGQHDHRVHRRSRRARRQPSDARQGQLHVSAAEPSAADDRASGLSGGQTCRAVTSQIDLAPTLLALTGARPGALRVPGRACGGASFPAVVWQHREGATRCVPPRCSTTTCCRSRMPAGRGRTLFGGDNRGAEERRISPISAIAAQSAASSTAAIASAAISRRSNSTRRPPGRRCTRTTISSSTTSPPTRTR